MLCEVGKERQAGLSSAFLVVCSFLCCLVLVFGSCWLFGRLVGSWLALWEDRSRRRIEEWTAGCAISPGRLCRFPPAGEHSFGGQRGPGVRGSQVAGW